MKQLIYTGVVIKAKKLESGELSPWKEVFTHTDESFTALKDKLFKTYGIDFEQQYILDANNETVYAFSGHQTTFSV